MWLKLILSYFNHTYNWTTSTHSVWLWWWKIWIQKREIMYSVWRQGLCSHIYMVAVAGEDDSQWWQTLQCSFKINHYPSHPLLKKVCLITSCITSSRRYLSVTLCKGARKSLQTHICRRQKNSWQNKLFENKSIIKSAPIKATQFCGIMLVWLNHR